MPFADVAVVVPHFCAVGKEPVQLHSRNTCATQDVDVRLESEECCSIQAVAKETEEVDDISVTWYKVDHAKKENEW